jgi:hypothetical protein
LPRYGVKILWRGFWRPLLANLALRRVPKVKRQAVGSRWRFVVSPRLRLGVRTVHVTTVPLGFNHLQALILLTDFEDSGYLVRIERLMGAYHGRFRLCLRVPDSSIVLYYYAEDELPDLARLSR